VLLLLPPSETKRDGGAPDAGRLDFASLGFPQLTPQRRAAVAALKRLSRSVGASMNSLKLGATQRHEVDRNRAVTASPVMPALDRYTGVLFDGLDAATLTAGQRAFAHDHVVVHSALFGLVRPEDAIPAYRLSHDSSLPGLSLRRLWRGPISSALGNIDGLVIDLRSESYVALGPATGQHVRVVSENASGRRLALSHFNKKAKGEFVRAIVRSGIDHGSLDSLLEWTSAEGIRLEVTGHGQLDLVV
jgi:cytoplasmic iron level regulating protein YaaA (DUF328/UPF0246 family)